MIRANFERPDQETPNPEGDSKYMTELRARIAKLEADKQLRAQERAAAAGEEPTRPDAPTIQLPEALRCKMGRPELPEVPRFPGGMGREEYLAGDPTTYN